MSHEIPIKGKGSVFYGQIPPLSSKAAKEPTYADLPTPINFVYCQCESQDRKSGGSKMDYICSDDDIHPATYTPLQ